MGVIHKLREDVVFFIVAQKKSDTSVSVRKLAALTSEKFQIKVSKSSVNIVLKNVFLSSSVGRRSGSGGQPEKFAIPPTKKKEISEKMNEVGFVQDKAQTKAKKGDDFKEVSRDSMPDILAEEKSLALEPQHGKKKESLAQKKEISEVSARQDQVFSSRIEQARSQKKKQGTPVVDGMGFVFLKAAQWEISSQSLMGGLLKKYIQASAFGHFDTVSDMFLFLKFLGVETFDHILAYRGHGLWMLNNFCSSPSDENKDLSELQKLFQWDRAMQDPTSLPGLIAEYKRERDQVLLEVKGFKLFLEDGSELVTDALMSSFGRDETLSVSAGGLLPIDKAMTWLSNYLISNIQSAVFQKAPGEAKIDSAFYDMVAAFENISGKRILRISVLGERDGEIAGFSTIPIQKRSFLVGVSPRQREFADLTKTVKWARKRDFYHEETDRILHFTETKTDFAVAQSQEKIESLRAITVWREKESEPCWVILTNQRRGDGEDILRRYISRWPYLDKSVENGLSAVARQAEGKTGEALSKISDVFNDFVGILHEHCQRHFFPPAYSKIDVNQLITSIYGIPGTFHETKSAVIVSLDVEITSAYRKDLEYAVKHVNERYIFDHLGRRVWLKI